MCVLSVDIQYCHILHAPPPPPPRVPLLPTLSTHLPVLVMIISVPSSWNLPQSSLVSSRHWTLASSLHPVLDTVVRGVDLTLEDAGRGLGPGCTAAGVGVSASSATPVWGRPGRRLETSELVADSTSFSARGK